MLKSDLDYYITSCNDTTYNSFRKITGQNDFKYLLNKMCLLWERTIPVPKISLVNKLMFILIIELS
jgi:hypothetical protein